MRTLIRIGAKIFLCLIMLGAISGVAYVCLTDRTAEAHQ